MQMLLRLWQTSEKWDLRNSDSIMSYSEKTRNTIKWVVRILTMFILVSFSFAVNTYAIEREWDDEIEIPDGWTSFDIQVNGVTVEKRQVGSTNRYTVTVNDSSGFVTAIKYKSNGAPEQMLVWEVNYFRSSTEELYGVQRVPELDNILGYKGFAIKAPDTTNLNGGIRCSLTFDNEIKANGVPNQGGGYSVKEYGMLHIFSRNWNSSSPDRMNIGNEGVETIPCYVQGGIDYVHDTVAGRTVFAVCLYDIVDYNVNKNFRGYVRLNKPSVDGDVYLYGPIVGKNPYYVAQAYDGDSTLIGGNQDLQTFVTRILTACSGSASIPSEDICDIYFIGDSIMMGETMRNPGQFYEFIDTDGVKKTTFDYDPAKYYQLSTTPSKVLGDKLTDRFIASGNNHYNPTNYRNYRKVNCTLIANGGVSYSQPGINSPYNMRRLAEYACSESTSDATNPEYIFLLAGINDWAFANQGEGINGNSSVFGDPDTQNNGNGYTASDNSYVIGVDRTIKRLSERYPNAKIIVCSPTRALKYISGGGSVYRQRVTEKTLEEYSNAQGTIVEKYRDAGNTNVYFIDLYHKLPGQQYLNISGNEPEASNAYLSYYPDRIHPNENGYAKMCQCILNELFNYGLIPDAPSRQTNQANP